MLRANALFEGACYRNEKNRKRVAWELLRASYKTFYSSKLIRKLDELIKVYSAFKPNNTKSVSRLFKVLDQIETPLTDDVKISISFENYLKSELLLRGFVIHIIDRKALGKKFKTYAKKQGKHPITISAIKKAEGVFRKRKTNYNFHSLTKKTINYSTLLNNPNYKDRIKLPPELCRILNNIRERRNSLHYLINYSSVYNSKVLTDYQYLKSIIDNRLVNQYNRLLKNLDFPEHWRL